MINTDSSTSVLPFTQLADTLKSAHYVDVKIVEGAGTLREFVARLLAYQPAWLTFLYRVRGLLARLLRLEERGVPPAPQFSPATVPMQPGEKAAFFTVTRADGERYWLAEAQDRHLDAALGVVAEPEVNGRRRFHVITIVHYHNWRGPLYFNLIRPFHHLVVGSMARAAAHSSGA
ncbi:MAG: DUF2867 domain-containing protein [Chloroflexi bacterium]|nr:DUF2867 domain-containing protein [Chloroflexota bacterium]